MNYCEHYDINYELLIAFLAIIISFISVTLTFWVIKIQQKHNKLSVRPIPEILLSRIGGIKIKLKNLGIGPLVCKELITKNVQGNVKRHIVDFLPIGLPFKGQIFTNRWNFTLLPGETITLLSLTADIKISEETIKFVMNALSELTLELKYTSMYDEIQPIYIKSLIWFKNPI